MRYSSLIVALLMLLALPATSFAARLYLQAPEGTVHVGDTISVTLMLDTEGEDVNAVEGTVLVSDNLAVTGVQEEGSIVPLWVERPSAGGQASSFSGVIPGGFRGVLSPFWEGGHPGTLYTLLLRATDEGPARATLGPSGRAFLNDGKGTMVAVTTGDAVFTIQAGGEEQVEPVPDTTLPEEFEPEVASSTDIFDGAFFVAFAANDLASGVDHYEVGETRTARPGNFAHAESPYRLTDQGLHSYVHVKAVDRAGNERIVTLPPTHPTPWYGSPWLAILIVLFLLGAVLAFVRHRFHAR
ncbi:MAG: hypothetical protein QOE22_460 [Candidatus Parcubacteria bacterium]|jgi:hypothetical protein|nr:hypothetical protein [Candidatus Parcubacteria bacterium]